MNLSKCIFCTSPFHDFEKCSELICNLCGLPGHSWKNCKGGKKCPTCNSVGHNEENCISRTVPCSKTKVAQMKCFICKKSGHGNCGDSQGFEALSRQTCSRCGIQGHPATLCPKLQRSDRLHLFREHVKEAMEELPDISSFMNCKERRYWDKVEKKAYKKLYKKQKLKKKQKKKLTIYND